MAKAGDGMIDSFQTRERIVHLHQPAFPRSRDCRHSEHVHGRLTTDVSPYIALPDDTDQARRLRERTGDGKASQHKRSHQSKLRRLGIVNRAEKNGFQTTY